MFVIGPDQTGALMNYASIRRKVTATLSKHGMAVARRSITTVQQQGEPQVTETTSTRRGVLFPIKEGVAMIRGNSVLVDDRMMILDGEGAISVDDKFVVGAKTMSVLSYEAIDPAGTVLAYEVHLRAS